MKLPNFHFPSLYTTSRLFGTGALVGPLVDGLHNQCLLEYHRAPISWSMSDDAPPLFCTSLWVPPLLGFAYVMLGGVLPRLLTTAITATTNDWPTTRPYTNEILTLRNKAWIAVATTALFIKVSEILETQSLFSANVHVEILLCLALLQWAWLDGTLVALLLATITSIGGPWSELPFVAVDVWEYLSPDTFPLSYLPSWIIDPNSSAAHLGLNSITGPCYFAVTMDAIALGRWYDSVGEMETETTTATTNHNESQ